MFSLFNKKPSLAPEYIIVGLGNPGSKYEFTRHNVGFMSADLLATQYNVALTKLKFKALYGDCMIEGKRCILLKPQTYMNNSGEAVRDMMNFYKVPAEKVIIVFDDISLPVGKIRIRKNGSDGGHNGMKSIIQLTGLSNFPRVKIGIGNKPHPDYSLADWVLSVFKKDEAALLKTSIEDTCKALAFIVAEKFDAAMNLYN